MKKTNTISLLLIILPLYFTRIHGQDCIWNLNTDIPNNDPLYMNNSNISELLIPESTGLTLMNGQSMILSCAGKSNLINGTGKLEISVSCTSNNQLLYNDKSYALKDLECSSAVQSGLTYTKVLCALDKGEMFNLGFNVSSGSITLIEICYDRLNEASFYSIHTLYGKSIGNAEIDSERPSFRTPGLTYGTTTANKYKQTEQKTRFVSLLGQEQADKYITTSSYLARGHLAPDADFIFGSWSFASYFYVNAAPEWQVVNAGNWLRVENMARDIAKERQENLIVYTGVYEVLKLPNQSGQLVDVYLISPNKLPVPKWYWKIIYSQISKEGIVMISLNNPHVMSIDPQEIFCKNICIETKWNRTEWSDFDKGYTFCCSVPEFVTKVKFLPEIQILKNMTGPAV